MPNEGPTESDAPEGVYAQRMRAKLTAAFRPSLLEIVDESEMHRGHGGYREGGETHFRVVMRAASLKGLSRVSRERQVYATLAAELEERVHALSLSLSVEEG